MFKKFRFQLNPTEEQILSISKHIGCSRFVYNWGLNEKSKAYSNNQQKLSCFDLCKLLTQLKKQEEYSWLNDVQAQTLQYSLRHLDNAFTAFFNKRCKFPKFKSKKYGKQSFQYCQNVRVEDNQVYLPKIGWVYFYNSREIVGTIKSVNVIKTPTSKYFVSILCDNQLSIPVKEPIADDTTIGIDLGIKSFAVTSDGEVFENQRHFSKLQKRLRVEQRKLSRRFKKGVEEQSKSYQKQRLVVAKVHEKITNQRLDNLHKISTYLVNKYDTICIEDLNVSGMLSNPKLAKHIQDCGWRTFRQQLELKCREKGKNLIVIGRFEPSSKRCNSCGHINQISLSDRIFNCTNCNKKIDRDFNAAQNIKDYGLGTKPLDVKTVQ